MTESVGYILIGCVSKRKTISHKMHFRFNILLAQSVVILLCYMVVMTTTITIDVSLIRFSFGLLLCAVLCNGIFLVEFLP